MAALLLGLHRGVVSLLIAGCLVAGLVTASGATSLVAAWSDDDEGEVSRSVGLMSGAQPRTVSLDDIGEGTEVSRSVGLMSPAIDDESLLQARAEASLEVSRSVGLVGGARGSSDDTTLSESVG